MSTTARTEVLYTVIETMKLPEPLHMEGDADDLFLWTACEQIQAMTGDGIYHLTKEELLSNFVYIALDRDAPKATRRELAWGAQHLDDVIKYMLGKGWLTTTTTAQEYEEWKTEHEQYAARQKAETHRLAEQFGVYTIPGNRVVPIGKLELPEKARAFVDVRADFVEVTETRAMDVPLALPTRVSLPDGRVLPVRGRAVDIIAVAQEKMASGEYRKDCKYLLCDF